MKTCSKCKIEKDYLFFNKDKGKKDGFHSKCRSCEKKYKQDNKEKIREKRKEYQKANKEYLKEYKKEWNQSNKENIKKYNKEYRQANKQKIKKYNKDNKENIKKRLKEWREANRENLAKYQKERRQSEPLFKMKCNLRKRTYLAFKNKGYSKNTKTQEILGVDWETTKKHIERQFTKGMSWGNYGQWHIDHIIPLASANTEEKILQLCHYSNLQPLWAGENFSKGDKINGQQTKIRI